MSVPIRIRTSNGFTLIELLVTVAIVAILAGVALPSYRQYVIRGNRSAAEAQMLDIANREEQFLLANRAYADKTTLTGSGYALPSEVSSNYDYDVVPGTGSVPSYTITFTAKNGQYSDGNLTLDNAGNKTPSEKWK
ncbi:MAG: type IV pilin protein [Burkholderiaceae bacterium]